jgi:hypothetical protein
MSDLTELSEAARRRRQCRNRIICGGCCRISGGEIGTLGARRIDKPVANTGQDTFTWGRRGRDRRAPDCQSDKSSCKCPLKLKRRVHVILPLRYSTSRHSFSYPIADAFSYVMPVA